MNTSFPPQWRSLDELAQTPEFRRHLEAEFPADFEVPSDPVSRRKFLGLMGASLALTGLAGCRRPLAQILPYAKMPEDLLPGVPQQYATVMPFRGWAEGILVTSNEGRPTKIEGNPGHPGSLGATHVFAQAAILELYDPDRSQHPTEEGVHRTWADFQVWLDARRAAFQANGGEGLRFLAEPTASPATASLREEILRTYPRARWHVWEPLHRDHVVEGARLAYGRPLRAQLHLDQADVILALDSDFLFGEPDAVRHAREFAARRRMEDASGTMNRLYVAESVFSVTGTMADHRLRLGHDRVGELAAALAAALGAQGTSVPGAPLTAAVWPPEITAWMTAVARDLAAHRGRAVVLIGRDQPPHVHALGHAINQALGAVGPVLRYTEEPLSGGQAASLRELASDLEAGRVDTLFIVGGNPAYDAPADLDLAAMLAKAPHTARLGLHEDETSQGCRWHLPGAHFLECWGDGRAYDGTLSIQQPLIAPLYEGRSEIELLSMILGTAAPDAHAWLRARYAKGGTAPDDAQWNRALHDGLFPDSAYPEVPVLLQADAVRGAWAARTALAEASARSLDVLFRPDNTLWDGRYANHAWLEELPDNLTKVSWDNPALVSPATARELGVENEDLVRVRAGGRELTLAAWIAPGLADQTVVLPLGYGRTRAGRVGNGVGFATYALRTESGLEIVRGATVEKVGGRYPIATTQNHHVMEGRPLVREASLEEYRRHPEFAREEGEHTPLTTIYTNREYDFSKGNQWGLAIDLNTCLGCNACTVACQSENNVAIVGKDQVRRGREMHWLRIDRYYTGELENPEAVHQPLPCMHCENAPCESVCPVNATSHSNEGLNEMTYNRCIGTKYCSNNCPYKVRRFNYFDWNGKMTEVEKMAKNPDVTVRMRGIMEKCTYCVQRINRAKITAKNAGREVQDGEITTACQQVCPTESIVFGNVNDPESRVARIKAQDRNYGILEEINTRPRTTYQAKLRNLNPELEARA